MRAQEYLGEIDFCNAECFAYIDRKIPTPVSPVVKVDAVCYGKSHDITLSNDVSTPFGEIMSVDFPS